MNEIVVVFGNDHTNTVGVIQSLGLAGYRSVALIYGDKTGYVACSKFVDKVITSHNAQACIEALLSHSIVSPSKIPIIPCSDLAALTLENNSSNLRDNFVFQYAQIPFRQIFNKEIQVDLAKKSNFNVPASWVIEDIDKFPENLTFPCLIKPLISCEGAKCDIRVCSSFEELKENLKSLKFTKKIILQEYIDRDYEISILGCSLSNGDCIIPAVENKLTIYPKYVGMECFANIQPLQDKNIKDSIINLIKEIGYVGLFSVEMMHSKKDNKFYFTEINLRNDGAESFITKYGANLPLNHVEDLLHKPITHASEFNPGFYIWDMHHLKSFVYGDISFITWIKEIWKSKGFLMYYKEDKKPFFRQYIYMLGRLLRIIKQKQY